jgi:hypothetical protein
MELATISVSRSKLRKQSRQTTEGFEAMVGRSVITEVFQDLTSSRLRYQRSEETLLTEDGGGRFFRNICMYQASGRPENHKPYHCVCQPVLSFVVSLAMHCCQPVLSIVVSLCIPL